MCSELCVICLVASRNEHPWWNLILWATCTLLPSTWLKVYSKISLHNVFTGGDLKRRNLLHKYCGLKLIILKMRSEDTLLEKWCDSLRFHLVTRQHFFKLEYTQLVSQAIKTYQSRLRGSWAFHLSSRTIGKSSMWQTIPKIGYLCIVIGLEVYSIVTYLLSEN